MTTRCPVCSRWLESVWDVPADGPRVPPHAKPLAQDRSGNPCPGAGRLAPAGNLYDNGAAAAWRTGIPTT